MSTKHDEMIEAVASTVADGEEQFIASLKSKGITDVKKIAAMTANFRIAKNFSDLVTPEEMEECQKAAGYKKAAAKMIKMSEDMKALAGMIGDEDEPSDVPNHEENMQTTKKSDLDLREIVKAVRDQLQLDFKSELQVETKKRESVEAIVRELLSSNREQEFVSKADKEFRFVPASNKEIAATLKSAYDVSPESGKAIELILGRVNDALSQSPALKTFGTSGHRAGSGGDAWSKICALADQIVQKSGDGKMTKEKARAHVLKTDEGTRLYEEYLLENPAQRAKYHNER